MRPYLIETSVLKSTGLIHGNVEDSLLNVIIQRVQLSVLRPALTRGLFNRLLQGVTNQDLTPEETELLDDYVTPLLACACDRKAAKALTLQFRNKGMGMTADEYFEAQSHAERQSIEDDIHSDTVIAREDMIDFIKRNHSKFPTYERCACFGECSCNGSKNKNSYDIPISFL